MHAHAAKPANPARIIETVIYEVARGYDLDMRQVTGRSQAEAFLEARCLACFLCTRFSDALRSQIGQRFGGRSAAWAGDTVKAYERRMVEDPRFRITAARITKVVEEALQ